MKLILLADLIHTVNNIDPVEKFGVIGFIIFDNIQKRVQP